MARKHPFTTQIASCARELAKTRPHDAREVLQRAFVPIAVSGDVPAATTVLEWMYGRLPPEKGPPPTNLSLAARTHEVFRFVAGLDVRDPAPERVRLIDVHARIDATEDTRGGVRPAVGDAWRAIDVTDPWRNIQRWRHIQQLARPLEGGARSPTEPAALDAIDALLLEVPPDEPGEWNKLAFAFDLALRHGRESRIPVWLAQRGHHVREGVGSWGMLTFRAVAEAVVQRGLLRETIGLDAGQIAAALELLDGAITTCVATAAAPKRAPKVQKRCVTCEYGQLHLEPETLTAQELEQVYFQDDRESAQGMSLFPTRVAIGSPRETEHADVEVTVEPAAPGPPDLAGAVQAVAFPIEVRGPVLFRSVSGEETDPLTLPPGRYDVLARFYPKKAPKAAGNMRVFRLALAFRPAGSLGAPKCLLLESGDAAPTEIFSH